MCPGSIAWVAAGKGRDSEWKTKYHPPNRGKHYLDRLRAKPRQWKPSLLGRQDTHYHLTVLEVCPCRLGI